MARKVNNWTTPDIKTIRKQNKAATESELGVSFLPTDVPNVLLTANAGNASLAYQYQDYQSTQILPSTATGSYLDKWGQIYLTNSDGSRGRKVATYSSGTATMVATVAGTVIPAGTQFFTSSDGQQIIFETIDAYTIDTAPTTINVRSLAAGTASNVSAGALLTMPVAIQGINAAAAIAVEITGGTDAESDDALRARILNRIQNPPMGGDANDWETWCLSVAGVTRAWCAPNEVAAGTVTIRIMCDELRATDNPLTSGLPSAADLAAVAAYLDMVRPVTVAQYFVVAPEPQPVYPRLTYLNKDNAATRAAIEASIAAAIATRARPARAVNGTTQPPQTIYRAWVSEAILTSAGVKSFTLEMDDFVPATNANIAVFSAVIYDY